MKRVIIFSLAAVTGVAGLAGAYVLSGHRWSARQVPFYVNPVNADVSEGAVVAALQSAADNWRSQSTADITIYYAGRTSGTSLVNNGKNEVFFRPASNGGTAAVTYWWYGPDQRLLDADIVFYDAGFLFFTGQSGCAGGVYIEDVATHEFGHFIGIEHSVLTDATMHPTFTGWCNQNWRTLSGDDIAAVEASYPATTLPDPPAAPAYLSAQLDNVDAAYVGVNWSDQSNNEDGFAVERSADGASFVRLAQIAANATWYQDRTAQGGRTYWYRVSAFNRGGSSPWSNMASVQVPEPPAPTPPGAPSPVSPAPGSTVDTRTLEWSSVDGAQSYDVYFGRTAAPPLFNAGVTGTAVGVGKLSAGTTYYWRVVARNSAGAAGSAVWSFSTPAKNGKGGSGKAGNSGKESGKGRTR